MKVLHIVQNYAPSVGGTQWLFQNISEGLVKNFEDEVTVFTTDSYYGPQRKQFKKIEESESVINGVKVMRFPFVKWHYPFFSFLHKLFRKCSIKMPDAWLQIWYGPNSSALEKAIQDGDYDVVCASSYFYKFMLYPLIRNKGKHPKPFVFMGAMHLFEEKEKDNLMKQTVEAIKSSEYYIANTAFEKQRLEQYGVEPSSVEVVGCGVDVTVFQQANSDSLKKKLNLDDKVVIGYFGRHDKIKGIDVILKAFEIEAKQNNSIALVIAGARSAYTIELESIINGFEEGIKSRCHIVSDISEKEKPAVYNCLDIFVSPSTHESFGIVFLEAWACKKPVIGANIGAVRSVIDNNIDGLLISPGNVEQLAAHFHLLINNPDLRQAMGLEGFNKVMEKYTWPIIVGRYRETYIKAIKKFTVPTQPSVK